MVLWWAKMGELEDQTRYFFFNVAAGSAYCVFSEVQNV
jgi:hypothetical protein